MKKKLFIYTDDKFATLMITLSISNKAYQFKYQLIIL